MLVESCKVSINYASKITRWEIIKYESAFNLIKRNKDKVVELAKSCKEHNLGMYKIEKGFGVNISTFLKHERW